MNKKLIIVTGYCATGKTTFSQKLSREFNVICLNKDYIKAILGKNLDIDTPEQRSRLSITTFNLITHFMEVFMERETPFIVESNFKISEGKVIDELLIKYDYDSLAFLFFGDLKILHKRFVERDDRPERDKANRSEGAFNDYDKFDRAMKPLGEFNTGSKIIKIDASYFMKVDFQKYTEETRMFLNTCPNRLKKKENWY